MTLIVGITGKRGHGKTTAAQGLEQLGFRHINFADPLREVVGRVYGVDYHEMTDPVLKEKVLDRYPWKAPRELLQMVGTELFRNYIEDTWIKAFERQAAGYSHVVCSDVRFENETKVIRARGGMIIKIVNESLERNDAAAQHASETGIDQIIPDYTIYNNPRTNNEQQLRDAIIDVVRTGSVEDLRDAAQGIVRK